MRTSSPRALLAAASLAAFPAVMPASEAAAAAGAVLICAPQYAFVSAEPVGGADAAAAEHTCVDPATGLTAVVTCAAERAKSNALAYQATLTGTAAAAVTGSTVQCRIFSATWEYVARGSGSGPAAAAAGVEQAAFPGVHTMLLCPSGSLTAGGVEYAVPEPSYCGE